MTSEQAAHLQSTLEDSLSQLGIVDPELGQSLCEQLRFQVEYPNQYVAFRDEWVDNGQNGARRLIRTALCHGNDLCEVYDAARIAGHLADPRVQVLYFIEG